MTEDSNQTGGKPELADLLNETLRQNPRIKNFLDEYRKGAILVKPEEWGSLVAYLRSEYPEANFVNAKKLAECQNSKGINPTSLVVENIEKVLQKNRMNIIIFSNHEHPSGIYKSLCQTSVGEAGLNYIVVPVSNYDEFLNDQSGRASFNMACVDLTTDPQLQEEK